MSKIEKYLGIANHDIQVANNSDELKSYVASILCEIDELQQENKQLKDNWNELKKYIQDICCYDEVGLRIIDPSYLEDKIAELERGVSNE